jgi:phage gp29-like protein
MNFSETIQKIERDAAHPVATRQAALLATNLLGALPNPDPILRKTGRRIHLLRDLLGDWEVFGAVELIHSGLLAMQWRLEQAEADQSGYEAFRPFFRAWDIRGVLGGCVEARNFGYKPFEFDWQKTDGGWMITGITGKPPEWFNFNAENRLQFKQKDDVGGRAVPPYKFGLAAHRASYRNPYGQALLSRVFWPVTFKKGGIEFMTKFLEKYGTPWAVGKLPRGASEDAKEKLLADLDQMVQDAVAVIPDDASVDLIESGGKGGSSEAFSKYLYYFDAAIDKVLLASETAMSVSKEGGDVRGDSREHAKVAQSVITTVAGMAEKVINEAIGWVWQFNYTGPPPAFRLYPPKGIKAGLAKRDNDLRSQGVQFSKQYYMKKYGLKEDDFEIREEPDAPPRPFRQKGSRHFADDAHDNQRTVDHWIEQVGGEPSDAANQAAMEQALEPVIDLINSASSMEEIMAKMAAQYPDMSTGKLEERLEKAFFVADIWGRLAEDEEAAN